jgi:hypothetical protein
MVTINPDIFAAEFDEAAPTTPKVTTTVPTVRQSATAEPVKASAYLTRPEAAWDWRDLRDYVVGKIQEMHPQLLPQRNEAKEFGMFSRFAAKYGQMAGPIAVFAFETSPTPGRWANAPIGLGRFAKASDAWFADKILARLSQN